MKHICIPPLPPLACPCPRLLQPNPCPERDSARVFVFGNSLIHHLTDTDETTVPHWLAVMARHDGRDLALDGRFGFPREFAAELPPVPNWSFDAVTPAWNPDQPFASARFDTIILNPENFIQYAVRTSAIRATTRPPVPLWRNGQRPGLGRAEHRRAAHPDLRRVGRPAPLCR